MFISVNSDVICESEVVLIGLSGYYHLGVLSSKTHELWALNTCGWMGVGNDPRYNNTRCFETFPFPSLNEGELKQRIEHLGEQLDGHRKSQQELYPDLTLTGIYNALEKLRSGVSLDAKDKAVHDKGLVSVLKQIHDDLDAAVLESYGWADLASAIPIADILVRGGPDAEALEQQLLGRLVALNHERAAEEKRGLIRWLRPDYQNSVGRGGLAAPTFSVTEQLGLTDDDSTPDTGHHGGSGRPTLPDWPAELPAQVAAIRKLLPTVGQDPDTLAACFGRKSQKRTTQISAILDTLKALGHID